MKREIPPRLDETYNPDSWAGDSPVLATDPEAEPDPDEETTAWHKMIFPI